MLLPADEQSQTLEMIREVKSNLSSNSRTTLQENIDKMRIVSQLLTKVMLYKPAGGMGGITDSEEGSSG